MLAELPGTLRAAIIKKANNSLEVDDIDGALKIREGNASHQAIADFCNDYSSSPELKALMGNASAEDAERLFDAWNVLKDAKHDARLNGDLLDKIRQNPEKKLKVKSSYENMAHPEGFKGKVNYTATKSIGGKSVSVKYDKYGFPEFDEFTPGSNTYIKSDNLTGNYELDNAIANKGLIAELGVENVWVNPAGNGSPVSIKVDGKWTEYTWHHHQDGKTMIPVKQEVHNAFSHSGGKQAIDSGLKGFFEY